jgi:hypothetical protein
MKTYVLLTPLALFLVSCATTQEEKLSQVRNLAYAAASIGTQEALLQNASWRPRFETAYANLNTLVTTKTVTGAFLREVLASLPVKELKSDQARIAIEGATMLFDATVGTKINVEAAPYVLAAATGIRDGLRVGLGKPAP